jgi:hypothetical protein
VGEKFGLANHSQRFERGHAHHGTAAVGAADATQMRGVHDFGPAGDCADRHPGAQRLGRNNDVGNDAVVLDGEKPAGSAASALHFIGDHDDAVLIAQLANALQKAHRNRQEASFALHRFDDDGGDRGGFHLRHHGLLQLLDAEVDVLVFGHACRGAIDVRDGKPHDLRSERAEAGFEEPVLAGEAQREQGSAMISAFKADHGGSPRVFARQLHRVFHRPRPRCLRAAFSSGMPGVISLSSSASAT